MAKTLIVVPCYNEEHRLRAEPFVRAVRDNPELEVVFVDDGSTDETSRVLEEMVTEAPDRLAAFRLAENSGKAEAVRHGFLWGFDRDFDLIGYWDADLATPLEEVANFCARLEDQAIRVVIGARVAMLGTTIERSNLRHYVGRVFATIASVILGLAVYDTQCGAKLFRNTSAIRAIFARPFSVTWAFDVEILAHLLLQQRFAGGIAVQESVVELPLRQWIDVAGSKIRIYHGLTAVLELARIARLLRGPKANTNVRWPSDTRADGATWLSNSETES